MKEVPMEIILAELMDDGSTANHEKWIENWNIGKKRSIDSYGYRNCNHK